MPESLQQQSVTVAALAHTKITLHAASNPCQPIHGILVGKYEGGSNEKSSYPSLRVVDALPVCHSAPTKPLLNMAFRLAESYCKSLGEADSIVIVGWYTANERLEETEPNQAALRIMSTISGTLGESFPVHAEPILLCVNNAKLSDLLNSKVPDLSKSCIKGTHELQAYGRDARKRWLQPLPSANLVVSRPEQAALALLEMVSDARRNPRNKELPLYDFEDQLEGGSDSIKKTDWLVNCEIANFVKSMDNLAAQT